ncbi:MAG: helix-turn-helix domain-containing protein [Candidatus Thorarchaeota archaeon]
MSGSEAVEKAIPVLTKHLGLTPTESKVLLPIYVGGNMTLGAIALLSGLSKARAKKALRSLLDKGLIVRVEGVVPIYRALPPSLALADVLANVVEDMRAFSDRIQSSVDEGIAKAEDTVKKVTDERRARMERLRNEFESYEAGVLDTVREQTEHMVRTTSEALAKFFSTVESTMNSLAAHLEDSIGDELSSFQRDLDEIQESLDSRLSALSTELDAAVSSEKASTMKTVEELTHRAESLIDEAHNAVKSTIADAESRLRAIVADTAETLRRRGDSLSSEALEVLASASDELEATVEHLKAELSSTYVQARELVAGLMTRTKKLNEEYAALVSGKIEDAIGVTSSMRGDIEDWKHEVTTLVESASQTVTNHLNQISAIDASYLDGIENVLSSHMEQSSSLLSNEYAELRKLVSSVRDDFETFLSSGRSVVVEMLQAQNAEELERLKQAQEDLFSKLGSGTRKTQTALKKQVQETIESINSIFETEVNELSTLVKNMDSRLRSAFSSVISSLSTRNETVLSGAEKFVEDFEGTFGVQLTEILNRFSTQITDQANATKELYESINARLDERLAEGVSTIRSHAERVETEIESAIADQVERIDRHAEGIRQEFHMHMEDITQQFISLVQGLEVAFNGLLTNQTMEARDLVRSNHVAFREAIRREIANLKEDSLRLQQEYASEIGARIDEVIESAAEARKALEELTSAKRAQVSQGLHETLDGIRKVLEGIENSLRDIERGSIRQMGETLVQLTREFESSMVGARETIAERLENAQEMVASSLRKSIANARNVAESFVTEETDHRQRFVADTSKKLDGVATEIGNEVSAKFDVYSTRLKERESESVRLRAQMRDEVISVMKQRRAQAVESLEGASAWVDSTMGNITASLETLAEKLNNDLTVVQQGLAKASSNASETVLNKGAEAIAKIETSTLDLIKQVESLLSQHVTDLTESASAQIDRSRDSITSLRDGIRELADSVSETTSMSADEAQAEIHRELGGRVEDLRNQVANVAKAYKAAADRLEARHSELRNEIFEAVKEALVSANVRASRRFESAGVSLKARLSSDIYDLAETVRNKLAAQSESLDLSAAAASNVLSERTSQLRRTRDEVIGQLEAQFDKSLRGWSRSVKKNLNELKASLAGTVEMLSVASTKSAETVEAIRSASGVLTESSAKTTWYLTGAEETCAHMFDMAGRAEKSIVISVPNPACLNVRKLSRVKKPVRRVLILPPTEEAEQIPKAPEGWRVWTVDSPPYLAVRDDEEIIVGGMSGEGLPFAVVSRDESYLRLYHDIVGPRLVRSRKA